MEIKIEIHKGGNKLGCLLPPELTFHSRDWFYNLSDIIDMPNFVSIKDNMGELNVVDIAGSLRAGRNPVVVFKEIK